MSARRRCLVAFTRPQERFVFQEREPVQAACPECGGTEASRYPVVSEKGWEMVVKCQACLCSLEREKWARLGPIQLLEDAIR
jgi:hypothetical protein